MTDWELATALTRTMELERLVRAHPVVSGADQEAARAVLRHTVAGKKALEQWISARVVRAQLQKTG